MVIADLQFSRKRLCSQIKRVREEIREHETNKRRLASCGVYEFTFGEDPRVQKLPRVQGAKPQWPLGPHGRKTRTTLLSVKA